jgi:dihydrofolate reductase
MRRLTVSNAMSLDGFFEGPDENVMALPLDEAFDACNAERLRAAETLLLGQKTYVGFKSFWPSVQDDPDATPTNREISRLDDAIDKVVTSDSLTTEQTGPWRKNTRIIGRSDAHKQIAELKRESGGDILVTGDVATADN